MSVFVPKYLKFSVSDAKKQAGIYCCAFGCKNKPHAKKRGLCGTHYNRYRQIIDPVYTRYEDFKYNALKRSKDFTITLQQFRNFCNDTGYIITKGKRGRAYSVDRIDNRCGYHIWNIQLMSLHDNIEKYHEVDKLLTDALDNSSRYDNEELPF